MYVHKSTGQFLAWLLGIKRFSTPKLNFLKAKIYVVIVGKSLSYRISEYIRTQLQSTKCVN